MELSSLQVFCEVAYRAVDVQDIVSGIDEYLDEVTVLPPSIWDPNVRLAPPKKTRTLVSNPPCHLSLVTIVVTPL